MNFIPVPKLGPPIIPPEGPSNAKIAIVGEAGGSYENAQLRPFVGPAGSVLEQCMHSAGLIRSEVWLTNVVKLQPPKNDIAPYFNASKNQFTLEGQEWVQSLHQELRTLKPNVIVACGGTAFSALTGLSKIMKYRGYVFHWEDRKVIPIIHPAAALRGQYLWRHLIATDLKKVKIESTSSEIVRPKRQLVYEFQNANEVLEWLAFYEREPVVCFDIEVLNYEISCIGLSSSSDLACSIPLGSQWSETDEALIFRALQRVLGNPKSRKVAQNAIFDTHFLLTRCGIEVLGPIEDTMVAHSVMFPELPKGLAFLGSIYCGTQPYWKDMVKFSNIKEES